ncbi:MAG TPA: hypothetical protein VGC62_14065, partial [Pseudomonas sp.]|uniref:RHS repeat domain-containing protein n=1 Tax=Pseudomonas sp. TaxID=306 RepID=UPI002F0592BD
MSMHSHTPKLHVNDPRDLSIREVAYLRKAEHTSPETQVTRHMWDCAGRNVADWDPRLWGTAPRPNTWAIHSLSGQTLLEDSVDAGWQLSLTGASGELLTRWDGRGNQQHIEYDHLRRPTAISEIATDGLPSTVERFIYGGPDASTENQCNRLIRHDDTAGALQLPSYGLHGSPLCEIRQFLLKPETPDWPINVPERDEWLEAQTWTSRWQFNALAETVEQTDARGNTQALLHTVAGQLSGVTLQLMGESQSLLLVSDVQYNAFGQLEQQTAGNGTTNQYVYEPRQGRLVELRTGLADETALQDLTYAYDPVGNIIEIEDRAQNTRFFANQKIEPINRYCYDSLYQLIQASGWEVSTGPSHGPALPDLQTPIADPNKLSNYTQTYSYDAGANLLQMRHVGAQSFTRTMEVATDSNRSLPDGDTSLDLTTGFDANGNLQELVRG